MPRFMIITVSQAEKLRETIAEKFPDMEIIVVRDEDYERVISLASNLYPDKRLRQFDDLTAATKILEEEYCPPKISQANSWRLDDATEWAIALHKGQTWANGLPYKEHLRQVDELVTLHGKDLEQFDLLNLRCAAWLHDAVEDTGVTVLEVQTKFGLRVAELVWAVTNEPGKNRKERHSKTYPKIRSTRHGTFLKLCDRIVNTRASINDRKYFAMYEKEYEEFRSALYAVGENEELWTILDDLMYNT